MVIAMFLDGSILSFRQVSDMYTQSPLTIRRVDCNVYI
jgi:hypothetical protein